MYQVRTSTYSVHKTGHDSRCVVTVTPRPGRLSSIFKFKLTLNSRLVVYSGLESDYFKLGIPSWVLTGSTTQLADGSKSRGPAWAGRGSPCCPNHYTFKFVVLVPVIFSYHDISPALTSMTSVVPPFTEQALKFPVSSGNLTPSGWMKTLRLF